jgi:hypothetical protein
MLADHSSECLRWFDTLVHGLETAQASFDKEKAPASTLRDELGRFRIWQASAADSLIRSDTIPLPVGSKSSIERVGSATLNCLRSLEDTLTEGNLPYRLFAIVRWTSPCVILRWQLLQHEMIAQNHI